VLNVLLQNPYNNVMKKAKRDWQVLLIGGASGVGKTKLSYSLARHYGVNLIEQDDFQAFLEKLTTPEQQPLLHFWRTNWEAFSSWSDEKHLEHFIQVSRETFQPGFEAVIANRLEATSSAMLEGDFILPELATMTTFGDEANEGRVKALFIYEEDEAQIAANYLAREGEAQPLRAHWSWLVNQWLCAECERLSIPAVSARPWDTVLERAVSKFENFHPLNPQAVNKQ
jgi:2-phosphoglycerate kinase